MSPDKPPVSLDTALSAAVGARIRVNVAPPVSTTMVGTLFAACRYSNMIAINTSPLPPTPVTASSSKTTMALSQPGDFHFLPVSRIENFELLSLAPKVPTADDANGPSQQSASPSGIESSTQPTLNNTTTSTWQQQQQQQQQTQAHTHTTQSNQRSQSSTASSSAFSASVNNTHTPPTQTANNVGNPTPPSSPPTFTNAYPTIYPLDVQDLRAREAEAVAALQTREARRGKGVSKEAQDLFDAFSRTMPTAWQGTSIVVADSVVIEKPYVAESCRMLDEGLNKAALERVQKVLDMERQKMEFRNASIALGRRTGNVRPGDANSKQNGPTENPPSSKPAAATTPVAGNVNEGSKTASPSVSTPTATTTATSPGATASNTSPSQRQRDGRASKSGASANKTNTAPPRKGG